jgi:hypothetical protein
MPDSGQQYSSASRCCHARRRLKVNSDITALAAIPLYGPRGAALSGWTSSLRATSKPPAQLSARTASCTRLRGRAPVAQIRRGFR